MNEIIFNKSDKPQLLLDIKYQGEVLDIHNDFDCWAINVKANSLILSLERTTSSKMINSASKLLSGKLEFKDFKVEKIDDLLFLSLPRTIDSFSIGQLGKQDQKSMFILGFVEVDEFEIYTDELKVRFW